MIRPAPDSCGELPIRSGKILGVPCHVQVSDARTGKVVRRRKGPPVTAGAHV